METKKKMELKAQRGGIPSYALYPFERCNKAFSAGTMLIMKIAIIFVMEGSELIKEFIILIKNNT